MALLDLLRRCGQFPLRAAHLNHQLRPGDCDADEKLVREYCQHWQIPLYCESRDVKAYSDSRCLSLEVSGRELRQEFFIASQLAWLQEMPVLQGVRVAMAHHLDDQAETILLHLGRGSGLDGLTGMAWLTEPWIRPLLDIRRQELEAYVSSRRVPWRQDLTNESLFTLRNRLRQVVLPAWRDALGYDPAPSIARSAASIRQDQAYLADQAQAVWQRIARQAGSAGIELVRQDFQAEPPAIQNRLLRRAWCEISGMPRDLEWRHVDMARSIVASSLHPVGHLDWPRQVDLDWDRDTLRFSKKAAADATVTRKPVKASLPIPLVLPGPGEHSIALRLDDPFSPGTLTVYRIDSLWAGIQPAQPDVFTEPALADCVIRQRQPGDRITLPARDLSKPLRKYFNEQGIPPAQRDRLPLVARESTVLWFPDASAMTCPGLDSAWVSDPGETRPPTASGALFRLEFTAELDNS
jgi:tRNA(Ile)-lysidine synthase